MCSHMDPANSWPTSLARTSRPQPLALLALLLLALTLGGCSPRSSETGGTAPPTPPAGGGTVVIAYGVDMLGVNELLHRRTTLQTGLMLFALYLPLLEEQGDHESGPPSFKPRLAQSYEFSDDHLALTFHLRTDVKWSDGVPVTAEDVRWTWQAQTHPDVAWDYAVAKNNIRDVEVIDPATVRFHFNRVYAAQLLHANEGAILPKHAWSQLPFSEWRKNPSWFDQHPVGDGAFLLESWQPQQRITLRRNPTYFEPGLPRVERVVFQITADASSQLALLRSGDVHFDEVDPVEAASVLSNPALELLTYAPRQFVFIGWNVSRPQFSDRRVRQALTLGIDRRTIIDTVYYGYAVLTASPYPTRSWVYNHALEPWPYDPQRAQALLAAAGWRDTDGDGIVDKDGKPLRFELLTNSDNRLRLDIQVMIQQQLRKIGVDVQPRGAEFNSMNARLYAHDFDATLQSVGVDTSFDLYYNFHSKAVDDFNWGLYSNPEVDRLIDELNNIPDTAAGKPLYDQLQVLIHEDQPVTFLYEPRRLVATRRELREVRPSSLSTFANLREWVLEQPPALPP